MRSRRGVTLLEMVIVMTLIGLLSAVAYPSIAAGVDTLRLNGASDSIVSFLNAALNRAERRQELVEVTITKADRSLGMRSSEPGFSRSIVLPEGVSISGVLPAVPDEESAVRRFVLYPGGTLPRIGVEIENKRGAGRIVRVDPITGVPQIERTSK